MSTLVTKLAVTAFLALLLAGLVWLAKRGRYPLLDAPDPRHAPTLADRLRYHTANALALAFGAIVACGLASLPAPATAGQLACVALYDEAAGRWLGAGFAGLGAAAWVACPLAERLVTRGPLQHFLWRTAAHWRRLDPRPITRATGRIVLFLGLVLHFAVREQHTSFTTDGVAWHDWPWQTERSVPWHDVKAVELVASFVAATGAVRDIPHLRLQTRGGEAVVLGRRVQRPRAEWERLGTIAADRAAVALVEVPR
jgi:hypothetical protein